MTVTIQLKGADKFRAALSAMSDDVKAEVGKEVMDTAFEMREDIQESIRKPGRGTMYYRIYDPESGYTKIYAGDSEGFVVALKGKQNLDPIHRASADGDAPASDTGNLLNSIIFDKQGPLTATVGSHLAYAVDLEYGTIKMAARPFFRPAVERIRGEFEARLEAAVKRATQ